MPIEDKIIRQIVLNKLRINYTYIQTSIIKDFYVKLAALLRMYIRPYQ